MRESAVPDNMQAVDQQDLGSLPTADPDRMLPMLSIHKATLMDQKRAAAAA
jgi:hypothetical protein